MTAKSAVTARTTNISISVSPFAEMELLWFDARKRQSLRPFITDDVRILDSVFAAGIIRTRAATYISKREFRRGWRAFGCWLRNSRTNMPATSKRIAVPGSGMTESEMLVLV